MFKILKFDTYKFSKEKICIKIFFALILVAFQSFFQMHVSEVKNQYIVSQKKLQDIEDMIQSTTYNLVYMKHSLQDMSPVRELEAFESDEQLYKYLVECLKDNGINDLTVEKVKDEKKHSIYHVMSKGSSKQYLDFFTSLRKSGLTQRVISVSITNVSEENIEVAFDLEAVYK